VNKHHTIFSSMKPLATLLIVVTSMIIFASPAQAAKRANRACSDAVIAEMPAWVNQGASYTQPGYKHGFGEARFEKGNDYQDLMRRARDNALVDLVSGIRVVVSAETGVSTVVETDGENEQVSKTINNKYQTTSNLELPNLEVFQSWQDYETCHVYVQVRVDESLLQLVMQKVQADSYYLEAQDVSKSLKARLFAINEAKQLALIHDFSKITASKSSTQLLRQYEQLEASLISTASRNFNAIFLQNFASNDSSEMDDLVKNIKLKISGSYLAQTECPTPKMCIGEARKQGAKYVSVVTAKMDKQKKNGFWVGDYTIEVAQYDVATERLVDQIAKAQVRVMNRHEYNVTLKNAVEKWFVAYEQDFLAFGSQVTQ
jgi:hypothetical protein